MPTCPACQHELSCEGRFCSACGAAVPAFGAEPTGTYRPVDHPPPSWPTPTPTSASDGRFAPGQVLDRRYRIVSRLGKGGMGEVYRADDLRLGQAVALKFLPDGWVNDPQRLALLNDEVRLSRQISH